MVDDPEDDAPGEEREFTPPPKHVAADRFASGAIRSAQSISDGLAEAGVGDDDPVVIDRSGPRHSLAALDRLLASALEEDEQGAEAAPGGDVTPEEPPSDGR
ncbi:hypothetical protein LQ327_18045 [Actinomycetospora endophytica]|uniref:Uncharacterized protein n=1 Tax=Actinomycetospora endophytica TaxID=2291215 RepID=A0ABS8PAW0_9PSEU|nr:hypothetical protein [Actinomycetospora endophytica]MCD2195274.1 hypothetical protein [Actinomycetospora endophytica]